VPTAGEEVKLAEVRHDERESAQPAHLLGEPRGLLAELDPRFLAPRQHVCQAKVGRHRRVEERSVAR
jgi:hypothetical protein